MSIARIGEFRAKDGQVDALLNFLTTLVIPSIRAAAGSLAADVYQSQADPALFTVIEVWTDIEAHQESVKQIPPGQVQQVMPMLAAPPTGGYYQPR